MVTEVSKGTIFLPHWITGRFNEHERIAIIFNNLIGETFLFEDDSAAILGIILSNEYNHPIEIITIAKKFDLDLNDLISFLEELIGNYIVTKTILINYYVTEIKNIIIEKRKLLAKKLENGDNIKAVFDSCMIDYQNRLESQNVLTNVSIEITYGCNEKCIHCYNPKSPRYIGTKKRNKDELNYDEYKSLLDQLYEMGVVQILFTGGDPFIRKDFLDIVEYAHKKKFTITINTNGIFLESNKEAYDRLIALFPYGIGLSIYSTDTDVHDSITLLKGSSVRTANVARSLCQDGVLVFIKCPILSLNAAGYRSVVNFAQEIGAIPQIELSITCGNDGDTFAVDILRPDARILKKLMRDPIIPLAITQTKKDYAIIRKPTMNFCGAGKTNININPIGEVFPCLAIPHHCGNIRTENLDSIFRNSQDLRNIRELTYGDSDLCGEKTYCSYCNRCIGQSYIEKGNAAYFSTDNCFIAKIREELSKEFT